jgi:hypothetical protein
MMATLGGYLFTLIARRPLGLQGTRGGPGAAPGCAVHAELNHTWERVICMSRILSCPRTCTRGYLVCRVPTVAPGPTSVEAVNPRVGPIFRRPARLS